MKRLIRNTKRLFSDPAPLALGAFLCAVAGAALWVSGGSGWYAVKTAGRENRLPSLAVLFIVWLLIYALYGFLLAAILLGKREWGRNALALFGSVIGSWLLSLGWYAVYFCTRLNFFSLILLLLSASAMVFALILLRRAPLPLLLAGFLIFALEAVFFCLSIASIL